MSKNALRYRITLLTPYYGFLEIFTSYFSQKHLTMPEEENPAKLGWKKSGPVAAQLFRDIYFGKYRKGSNGKFCTAFIRKRKKILLKIS